MLSEQDTLDRLKLLFKRATALPELSVTATRLIEAIDSGEASAVDLERIIMADPLVAAMFLRVTAYDGVRASVGQGTIRAAVMRLGQKSVRSLAVSLALKNLLARDDVTDTFNREMFAKHSLAVGFLARYLMARRRRLGQPVVATWTADELFAAGVLHDLCIPLLARIAPDVFERISLAASEGGVTLNTAFSHIFEFSTGELGSLAAEAWGLPPVFVLSMRHMDAPMELEAEYDALACLNAADHFATGQFGYSAVPWPVESVLGADVASDFDIPEEELQQLGEALKLALDHFLTPAAHAA